MMSSPERPDGVPLIAIIAGHGDFAAGMISAVEHISGAGRRFVGVSNRDLSPAALVERLGAAVRESAASVVFTDLPAGSCTIAARRLQRDLPELLVIAGTNLPILLNFALGGDIPGAVDRALSKARDALAAHVDTGTR